MSQLSVSLGNMLYEKRYADVIEAGIKLLKTNPEDASVHVALMDAYFKLRNEDNSYLSECGKHARLAILYGHNTGYAHDRLLKTLKSLNLYHQAIQLCNLVLNHKFAFVKTGCGKKETYEKAKDQLNKLLPKSADSKSDILFDKDHISAIISRQQERLRLEREANRIFKKAEKCFWTNESEYERLMKQYHDLQDKMW